MADDLLLLWLAAFPLMGSPGPATISLAGTGVAFGFRPGLSYLCGIILGTASVLFLIATGVTAIILMQPFLVAFLSIAAGLYILYLAMKIATAPVGARTVNMQSVPRCPAGFALAIANPKAFAAIGAVYSGRLLFPDDPFTDAFAKILALVLVIVIVNTAWLGFGSLFARILSDPKIGRIANIAFALMLVLSVGFALWDSDLLRGG